MNTQPLGRFITIEGLEASGKSTAAQWVANWMKQHNYGVCMTREPGGTAVAEAIRALLLHAGDEPVDALSELLLFFAARNQHVQQLIKPALMVGEVVVCDRFIDATYAYQGSARGMPMEIIESLENWVLGNLQPHFTLLLDVPVEISLARLQAQGQADRIEQEDAAFFERVRKGYLLRAQTDTKRYAIINSTQSLAAMQAAIEQQLARWFSC